MGNLIFERNGDSSQKTATHCKNLASALSKLGVQVSAEQAELALKETVSVLLKVWDTNKDLTHLDHILLITKFITKSSVPLKKEWIAELSTAYVSPLFKIPPHLNPDARKVLLQLKNKEKLVGLICNTGITPGFGLRRFLTEQGVRARPNITCLAFEKPGQSRGRSNST